MGFGNYSGDVWTSGLTVVVLRTMVRAAALRGALRTADVANISSRKPGALDRWWRKSSNGGEVVETPTWRVEGVVVRGRESMSLD